ncbi:MAG: polyvinylalcohol dehydrogenase [Acidobacteria bacterium]|nr:polyvinylalcohol dehydrogenase [Acidobacteriota bacterium]
MKKSMLLVACAAFAADWPQWRGPNRDGKSAETGLLKQWPAEGPKKVWTATGLGQGYSSMTVAGGRIFTQGQSGNQFVVALDEKTGKELWRFDNGGGFSERRGDGPRSMPTVEGNRLWAFSAAGNLASLDAATGKKLWQVDVTKEFGGSVPHWGYSESPLIDGDRLIVAPGGSGASVVALNKNTGKVIWKTQSDPAHYSSAIVVQVGGVRQIMTMTARAALGLRADNGELLWRYSKIINRTANVATPVYHNGQVFYSSDYGTGCALLKVDGSGANEVYFNQEMKNHHASSILLGEHLYGFSSAVLTSMKWASGEVAWKDRSVGKGSLIWAEGMLYLFGENGTAALVEPSPEGYREKSRFSIEKGERPAWSYPVVANGRLYLRDQDNLHAYDIKR